LGLSQFAAERDTFQALLAPDTPHPVRQAALRELARFDDPAVAPLLLAEWKTLGPRARGAAMETLLARDAWVTKLLSAVAAGDVAASEIPSSRLDRLAAHSDAAIAADARAMLGERGARRRDVLRDYEDALAASGDAERGRVVFTKHCAACHRLGGVGHEIGPNLTSAATRGAESLLVNVLDPNREVNPQFASYVAVTHDGRAFSGMIAGETATSITLVRGEEASDTLLRVDIDELTSTGASLMPEGLEKEIDPAAMNDLLTFLLSAP
jgi:putative heme-binding domain-containing protein